MEDVRPVKQCYCIGCGECLGPQPKSHMRGDTYCCGKSECIKEERDCLRQQDEEARERAEADEYDRYR